MATISIVEFNLQAFGFLSKMSEKIALWIVIKNVKKNTIVISSGYSFTVAPCNNNSILGQIYVKRSEGRRHMMKFPNTWAMFHVADKRQTITSRKPPKIHSDFCERRS